MSLLEHIKKGLARNGLPSLEEIIGKPIVVHLLPNDEQNDEAFREVLASEAIPRFFIGRVEWMHLGAIVLNIPLGALHVSQKPSDPVCLWLSEDDGEDKVFAIRFFQDGEAHDIKARIFWP